MSTQSEVVSSPGVSAKPPRLASIDAFRGFVMLLMMAEVLRFARVAKALPDSCVWGGLAWLEAHVEWVGCSLHDMIQPGFSFLVGVALPFSLAGRMASGMSKSRIYAHTIWRSLLLVLLGVFLRSIDRPLTNWTFEDTLTQIGLGYCFLFSLGFRPMRDLWIAFVVILSATWLAFVLWPLPPADFDFARVGVSSGWLKEYGLNGFAAHWQKNSNLAWAFDTWFLNLFPRDTPFLFNRGGYATLSFVPTLGTMILGLVAGIVLRGPKTAVEKIRWFVVAGVIAVLAGVALHVAGICPIVKRVWTPAWVLASGGGCFLFLAFFHGVIEVAQWRRWAFPLVVVGSNSIAAYLIAHLFDSFIRKSFLTHFGVGFFRIFGAAYEPFFLGTFVLLAMWAILFWMWKRKLFLKI